MRLITLGRLALVVPPGGDDEALNKRRRKLALLAVLALARRPLPRDVLLEMFWGDQDEARARHSLSDALSHLRRVLGRDAITLHAADVQLEEVAGLEVDALEFAEAGADKDWERAAALYGGPFLHGVYIAGSSSFEQWVTRERMRLEGIFLQACEKQCMALARTRRWEECGALAARWLDAAPLSTDAALFRLNALKAPGTRDADQRALAEYERMTARLAREFDLAPDRAVAALARDIAERLAATGATADDLPAPAPAAGGSNGDGGAVLPPPPPPVPGPPALSYVAAFGRAAALGQPAGIVVQGVGAAAPAAATSGAAPAGTDAVAGEPAQRPSGEAAAAAPTAAAAAEAPAGGAIPIPKTSSEFRALSTGEFRALRQSLESKRQSHSMTAAPAAPAAGTAPADALLAPPSAAGRARRRRRAIGVALVALAGVVAGGWAIWRSVGRDAGAAAAGVPARLAIIGIRVAGTDTASAWMPDALAHMIASKLERSSTIEVVSVERVRDVLRRANLDPRQRALTDEERVDLGLRLGATWVVSGRITGADSSLLFIPDVHDVRSGRDLGLDEVVTGRNIISLADAAASRLLEAAGAAGEGPRLADIETSSVEAAEHFARGMQALGGGLLGGAMREMDAAIALDSGFISAVRVRMDIARQQADTATVRTLDAVFERNKSRATEWDRRSHEAQDEWVHGDVDRAESLARDLVRRFPRDPRAYAHLASVLVARGRWDEAEQVMLRELALDSLALEAGTGACAACSAYPALVEVRWLRGDQEGAERAARRFLALAPQTPAPWVHLARLLAYQGRYEAALEAHRRAIVLSGGEASYRLDYGRTLLMMRDLDGADSVASALVAAGDALSREHGHDLRIAVERERGRLRASNADIAEAARAFPGDGVYALTLGNNLGRLGDYAGAAREYERITHLPEHATAKLPYVPGMSRSYSWHHALLADAIAPGGDTVRLKAIADSLVLWSAGSYYARDQRLHHHVRGLVHALAGRYALAEREFRAAMWGAAGWTRTNVELAKAQLAQGRAREAIATLRTAYGAPVDAMGRYQIRSEIDYWMALAFRKAGQDDSAAVYSAYVRRAWRDADPEVAGKLEALLR